MSILEKVGKVTAMTDLDKAIKQGLVPWTNRVQELSDFHVVVFEDGFPVTSGHLLFVPMYNNNMMIKDCFTSALYHGQRMVNAGQWDAFNIGFNCGTAAGQTIMYPHVHLIPRRKGDCEDPTGGVRGVIARQQNYKTSGYTKPN